MNKFKKIKERLVAGVQVLHALLRRKPRVFLAVAGVVIIAVATFVFLLPASVEESEQREPVTQTVELIPVSALGGEVGSGGTEVVLRAESSGKINRVLPVGTRVGAGVVVAEFERSAQQASLLQAEGALEAAESALKKTQGGLRSERLAVLQSAYDNARAQAVTTLLSAYATVDSAVRDTGDRMLSNPESSVPQLAFATSNSQRRIDIEGTRVSLGQVLARHARVSESLSVNDDIENELTTVEAEVRTTRTFIDQLVAALNEAIPTGGTSTVTEADITSLKAAATAARTALTGSLTALSAARTSIETAEQNLTEGITGAEAVDLAAAQAQVKQAQGAYNTAFAAYDKTFVRTSSPGTIVACSATVGEVLTIGSDVCRIKTVSGVSTELLTLPLSSVKYTPQGAQVFVVSPEGILDAVPVVTSLVTAEGIVVQGLLGDEYIVRDVRGLKAGEKVTVVAPQS